MNPSPAMLPTVRRPFLRVLQLVFPLLLVGISDSLAQSDGILQINGPIHEFLIRQQTAGLLPGAHLTHLPLSAYEARAYLDSLEGVRSELIELDRSLLDQYRGVRDYPGASWGRERGYGAFSNGRDLISKSDDDYAVQINPLINLSYGRARRSGEEDRSVWRNSRGARISGHLGKNVFFEGRFTENQEKVSRAIVDARSSPRRGFTNVTEEDTYDWMQAVGMIGFRSRFFELRFGRDTNRWGSGIGSTILSNFASPYDQFQIRTTFWRFQYVSTLAGFAGPRALSGFGDQIRLRKYAALHRLSIHLPGRLEFSLFESVVFATDSLGQRQGFDMSYVNPIIFLRAAERDRGSPDNALVGSGLAWYPLAGLKVYGQFLLDEYKSANVGKKWWANKWAWMIGSHLSKAGLDGLSVRFELSRLRPFIYSHDVEMEAYVHHGDLLGHPAGPNAWDGLLYVDYRISTRLTTTAALSYTVRGRNDATTNYGSDPRVSYETRSGNFGHSILQGIRQEELLLDAFVGYELLPSLYLDGVLRFHSIDDEVDGLDRSVSVSFGMRWGVPFAFSRY